MAIDKKTGKTYASTMKATSEWQKKRIRQVKVNFNLDTDSDVLAKLDSVPNRTEYLRDLIRSDIAKKE